LYPCASDKGHEANTSQVQYHHLRCRYFGALHLVECCRDRAFDLSILWSEAVLRKLSGSFLSAQLCSNDSVPGRRRLGRLGRRRAVVCGRRDNFRFGALNSPAAARLYLCLLTSGICRVRSGRAHMSSAHRVQRSPGAARGHGSAKSRGRLHHKGGFDASLVTSQLIPQESPIRLPIMVISVLCAVSAPQFAHAQIFDPSYPVCLQPHALDNLDCHFTSPPQCALTASGLGAECVIDPYYAAKATIGEARKQHDKRTRRGR
jgi:hypothetical protein